MLTLAGMLTFWGFVFLGTTLYVRQLHHSLQPSYLVHVVAVAKVWFYKPEAPDDDDDALTVIETFREFLKVLQLPSVRSLALVLITFKMAFGPTDGVSDVKFVEYGLKKESVAFMSPLITIVSILAPMAAGEYTASSR